MRCNYGACQADPEPDRKKCSEHLARCRAHSKRWAEKHSTDGPEKSSLWHSLNADKDRDYRLRSRYGITLDDYLSLWKKQNGLCAICGRPERYRSSGGNIKNLAVDHDHDTGRVRGLLCQNCNRAIGFMEDNAELLICAAEYLGVS